MEERLQRRKLDALKRGVHRVDGETIPVAAHVVGIGKAGAGVICAMLRQLQPGATKFTALAIDLRDHDFAELRDLAAAIPSDRAEVTILPLEVPGRERLLDVLAKYQDFLTLEYPRHRWNPAYEPWLAQDVELPQAGGHFQRAVAKGIFGYALYNQPRTLEAKLREFAESVDAARGQAVVAIVFGMGGGTGGGIAVDLARHLSNRMFGRRVLVAGIGIAPCDGDLPEHRGSHLFPLLNELDCLADEEKNQGIVMSCGELFRNPFTAGFIMVPQQHVWASTQSLPDTHRRVDAEIGSLLTARNGANFWELLRMLNWVAAPSTQHSAARTPWGLKWLHLFGFADAAGEPIAVGSKLPQQLGILPGYRPEFIEVRVEDTVDAAAAAEGLDEAFHPEVPPQLVGGGRAGSVQFILPRLSKSDLRMFSEVRALYDFESPASKLAAHSLLLEQGVLLSEPSTQLDGMAGASLWGGNSWVAVPLAGLRGYEPQAVVQEPALRQWQPDRAARA